MLTGGTGNSNSNGNVGVGGSNGVDGDALTDEGYGAVDDVSGARWCARVVAMCGLGARS
jgi:hypothetical protein